RRRHTSFSRDWSSDVCSSDLFNNIFYSRNGAPMVVATDTTIGVSFHNNAYFSEHDRYTFVWGDDRYTSLHDFKEATRQETMNGRSEERRVGKGGRGAGARSPC